MEMRIPRLRAHRADIPEELEGIVMKALERDRRRRFATAADMARALDDFVVGSRLHLDEVARFVRQVEAISPLARPLTSERPRRSDGDAPRAKGPAAAVPDREAAPTLKEFGFRRAFSFWGFRPSGSQLAAVVGLALAMLGLTTAFGLRVSTAAEAPPAVDSAAAHR
jgi:hypothetical protein